MNQIIEGEVIPFFEHEDQSVIPAAQVENILLNRINTRFRNENVVRKLKGALAYRPMKALPPNVIARCIMERDLPHLGLLADVDRGDSEDVRDTAALVSYAEDGPDQGLYVNAGLLVRNAARQYNSQLLKRDLEEIMLWLRDEVPLLSPSSNGDVVALSNGLFDLRDKTLRPFTPEVVLSSKCEARWDANATVVPVIDGWDVDSWIRDIADEDEEVERLLWQVIAALFRPDHSFDKAIFLVSESGSNGKGTFLELLRNLVGRNRVATVSLADFDRPFMPIQLASSFAVLSDESSVGGYLQRAENLKSWISHDWVMMDRKNRDSIQVKGRGLSVFCLNELPSSRDKTESLYRRFLAVPFKRRYVDGDKNPLIKSDYLKRPEVLDYVTHKALSMPLFDEFDVPAASAELLDDIRVDNDPVSQFAEELLSEFSWAFLPWKLVHAVYCEWMKRDNPSGRATSAREFTKRMAGFVDAHPECGWIVPRGADGKQKAVRTDPFTRRFGDDRLVSRYDLWEWKRSSFSNVIPHVSRGLLRVSSVSNADDDNPPATPTPQQQGILTPESEARVLAAQSA
ncbi:DNA primase family protein [Actinotignum sp. GS-2025b]|uniref:DNA primase family protein n=1 Tax=Actinotignum sp. GS-2025b TaxID=3427275 RepID=UPI003F44F414